MARSQTARVQAHLNQSHARTMRFLMEAIGPKTPREQRAAQREAQKKASNMTDQHAWRMAELAEVDR